MNTREGEDCPISASIIGLICALACLLVTLAVIIYVCKKKKETQTEVIVETVPVKEEVPMGDYQGCLQKRFAQKVTLAHSHLSPPFPSLNGTRKMGT